MPRFSGAERLESKPDFHARVDLPKQLFPKGQADDDQPDLVLAKLRMAAADPGGHDAAERVTLLQRQLQSPFRSHAAADLPLDPRGFERGIGGHEFQVHYPATPTLLQVRRLGPTP